MSRRVVAQAMQEYGQAMCGDWSDVDGRSVRNQMDEFASAVLGGPPAHWDIHRWRESMGVCPDGGGHWGGQWGGAWGHCETDAGCPSLLRPVPSSKRSNRRLPPVCMIPDCGCDGDEAHP